MAFVGDFYHPEPFGMSPTPRRKGLKARKLTNMKKSYEYRAYPTTKQRHTFLVWLALLRNVYNQALAWRIDAYQKNNDSVKWTTQANALPDPIEVPVHTTIGVDVGLNSFAVDSDGEHIPNPRHYRQSEKRLGKHQRVLS